MRPKTLDANHLRRDTPGRVEAPATKVLPVRAAEHESITTRAGPRNKVRFEVRNERRRDADGASTGIRLGRTGNDRPVAQKLSLRGDTDGSVEQVEVTPPQSLKLTESETAEGSEKHQRAEPRLDGVSQNEHLGDSGHRSLAGVFHTGALEHARIL